MSQAGIKKEIFQGLWTLYFPEEEFELNNPKFGIVNILAVFFRDNAGEYVNIKTAKLGYVQVNFTKLQRDIPVADFEKTLKSEPHTVLTCLNLAMHACLLVMDPTGIDKTVKIYVRLFSFDPITPMKAIKSNLVEKFVAISGNVIRVGSIRPLVVSIPFICKKCNARFQRYFPDGRFQMPSGCPTQGCKMRTFEPDKAAAEVIDFQKVKIQEVLESDPEDVGRIPRTIECELTNDLVDSCIPGDSVCFTGIVKAVKSEITGSKDKDTVLFLLYLDVKSVNRELTKTKGDSSDLVHFTSFDYERITEIANLNNGSTPFYDIVHSLCPAIFGQELVKAGLMLAMFGGSQAAQTKDFVAVRGDPHVLVVGDPGLGKSQLLKACCNVAPRSVYVCGTSATTTGLTVSMVKDGSDYALEAGALILADQGICCIDEFDKMHEHEALFEAMEQQSISIAKAGMICSLSARSTILAAANPVGGHYNKSKSVNENLKISAPLLSRFDIIFVLLDCPDTQKDLILSEHVIALHSGMTNAKEKVPSSLFSSFPDPTSTASSMTVIERLKAYKPRSSIPHEILRKYIAYAKKYVHPRLSPEAKAIITEFYINLRKTHNQSESTPITTRQLESTIRLAEARAKMDLRLIVTDQDALEVIEIINASLADVSEEPFGNMGSKKGKKNSKIKVAQQFMQLVKQDMASKGGGTIIYSENELYELLTRHKLKVDNFNDFLENLNLHGYLLKKGNRKYQPTIS